MNFLLLLVDTPLLKGIVAWPFGAWDEGRFRSTNFFHRSPMLALFAGNMLYCSLYRLRRCIGGTNWPDTRYSSTLGEK